MKKLHYTLFLVLLTFASANAQDSREMHRILVHFNQGLNGQHVVWNVEQSTHFTKEALDQISADLQKQLASLDPGSDDYTNRRSAIQSLIESSRSAELNPKEIIRYEL